MQLLIYMEQKRYGIFAKVIYLNFELDFAELAT